MPQIFHPSANTLSRLTLFAMAVGPFGLLILTYLLIRSPYQTQVRVIREQPVPFSHEHHVQGLGIDCRYCHTTVETSAFAGLPPPIPACRAIRRSGLAVRCSSPSARV